MSETTNSVSFTCYYEGTTQTRDYELSEIDSLSADVNTIRNKVEAINESIAGGTATLLANMFVSDDYNQSQNIGSLKRIDNVKLKTITETAIPKTSTRMPTQTEEQEDQTENND